MADARGCVQGVELQCFWVWGFRALVLGGSRAVWYLGFTPMIVYIWVHSKTDDATCEALTPKPKPNLSLQERLLAEGLR